jgi:magnesium transporter
MNFKFMPELDWKWGYPAAVGLMVGVGFYMHHLFKKSGWL